MHNHFTSSELKTSQHVQKKSELEVVRLQQQETTSGFTSVSLEQETEAIMTTNSLKMDSRILENKITFFLPFSIVLLWSA